jgi:hypothetical protein
MIRNVIGKISNMSSWYLKSVYDLLLEKATTDKEGI